MYIKKLHIDNFKCLQNFDIDFNSKENVTILTGENGTGKSLLLELIIKIFMSIYSLKYNTPNEKVGIGNYIIEYIYASKNIKIQKKDNHYYVWENDKLILQDAPVSMFRNFLHNDFKLLPTRIIFSDINTLNKDMFDIEHFDIKKDELYMPKKNFIYCDDNYIPIYLCSSLCCNSQNRTNYLKKLIGIKEISKIKIRLDTEMLNKNLKRTINVDDVERILKFLNSNLCMSFQNPAIAGNIYDYSISKFSNQENTISIFNFFDKLQTIFNASITVDVNINNKIINCNELSQGQQQLIKVIGTLELCRFRDTLILLDEPDIHMGPKWKYELYNIIQEILISSDTQVIITTHDPLIINGVSKEAIRIFEYDEGIIKTIKPENDAKGMGIDGLLQSEYYGLPTTLDIETKKKLDKKYDLMVKSKESKDQFSDKEKQELEKLTEELENMTFSRNIPTDIYYDEYVAAMHKIYRNKINNKLSREETEERNAKAEEILRELLKEK